VRNATRYLFFVKPIMLRTVFRVFRKGIDYLRDPYKTVVRELLKGLLKFLTRSWCRSLFSVALPAAPLGGIAT